MKFEQILPYLRAGHKVRRRAWHTGWSKLQQHMWYAKPPYATGVLLQWMWSSPGGLRAADLDAEDWEIYEPGKDQEKGIT